VRNLAHFVILSIKEHFLINMNNTIFSLTSEGFMLQKGEGLKPEQGLSPHVAPSL